MKDCTKFPKPNKQYKPPARVCPHWLFVLRSRPCSPEGGVKAPAVKPCIVYITLLPCSVGSKRTKCLAAITVVYPHCRLLHWWLTCEYTKPLRPPTQEKREFQEDPSTTTKPPKARRVRGKQLQPQTLGATINIPEDNKTPNVDEAETAQEETGASSSSKAPVRKPTMNKAISPSKVGIQVIREKFEEMNNSKNIDTGDYQRFQEVYGKWKSSKGEDKKQHLKEAKELYKSIIYPKLKSK